MKASMSDETGIRFKNITHSFLFKFIIAALAILIPIIPLIFYTRYHVRDQMRVQAVQANQEVIRLYLNNVDNILYNISKYLANFVSDSTEFRNYNHASGADERILALVAVQNKMKNDIVMLKQNDMLYMYNPEKGDFVAAGSGDSISQEIVAVNDRIKEIIDLGIKDDSINLISWETFTLNRESYLYRVVEMEGTYAGAWIKLSNLPIPADTIDSEITKANAFIDDEMNPLTEIEFIHDNEIDLTGNYKDYYISGKSNRYIVTGKDSMQGEFAMIALIPDNSMSFEFSYLSKMIVYFSVSLIIVLACYMLFMNRVLLKPMNKLVHKMQEAGSGNLDIHLETRSSCLEFEVINETFNSMITQIKNLKIDVYEERLNRQKLELERLKLQMKPHFFLNSLNVIYLLAKQGKRSIIMEMTMYLVKYYRYMLTSNTSFVPLGNELEHIRNYLNIHRLKSPDSLQYNISVPDFLLNTPVPPLLIHTFVENSIKHSNCSDKLLNINITASLKAVDGEDRMHILIEDNGCGFSTDILKKLNNNEKIVDEIREHIGISNIRNRLSILYKSKASISFENSSKGGAVVLLDIPLSV